MGDGGGSPARHPLAGVARTDALRRDQCRSADRARDMQIPRSLDALYGHMDFGIYLGGEDERSDRRRR